MTNKTRLLFVCTHNSARSQMAEGFLNRLGTGRFEATSAGTEPGTLHPLAVQVMAEEGIDISGHHAKGLGAFVEEPFAYVITVCDDANEACPVFPNARHRLHWSFPDPSRAQGTPEERLAVFRAVREAIRLRVEQFVPRATASEEASGSERNSSKEEERDGRRTRMGI